MLICSSVSWGVCVDVQTRRYVDRQHHCVSARIRARHDHSERRPFNLVSRTPRDPVQAEVNIDHEDINVAVVNIERRIFAVVARPNHSVGGQTGDQYSGLRRRR
jgi:hypothetical protein